MRARLRLRRGVLALALAGGLIAIPAAASAHNGLVGTDPGDGAEAEAVTEVSIEFAEAVLDVGATVEVVSEDGVDHAVGEPEIRRKRFIVQQVGVLPAGEYEVSWRTVGEDGHPIKGTFGFTVPAEPVEPTPSGRPRVDVTAPPAPNVPAGSEPGLSGADSGGGLQLGWRGIVVPAAIGAVLVTRIVLRRLHM